MIDIHTWYQKCPDCGGTGFTDAGYSENSRWRTKICNTCDGQTWVDRVRSDTGKIIGGLAAFAINMIMDRHGGEENMGCCPLCCAPCASLKRLMDIGAPVGQWVNLASGEEWDTGAEDSVYSWQLHDGVTPGGDVNWALITERWTMVDCHEGTSGGDRLDAAATASGMAVGCAAAGEGGTGEGDDLH